MADPVADFLNAQYGEEAKADLQRTPTPFQRGDSGKFTDTLKRGVRSGVESMAADVDYFQALAGTLVGADEFAAENIRQARRNEELSSSHMQGLESFSDFIDQPTVEGFFSQVASGVGQLVPSAISTVAGAGVGAATAFAGSAVLSSTGKLAAKNLVREALDKTARGLADVDDREIAQSAFQLYREEARKAALKGAAQAGQRGALLGAGVSEYVPLAGGNLSESLESGRELDPLEAIRAGLVAAPQAAIGVGGEVALLKLVGDKAKKLSTGKSSVMGRLAADITEGFFRGGAIEAGTEVVQEGISVANRSLMDENFSAQDAQMRLGQAAFAAFFGGGAAGSAAAGLGGAAREVLNAPETLDGVMGKARGFLEQGREQQVNEQTTIEQIGEPAAEFSEREPQADVNAQLEAMLDPKRAKFAVWIEGSEPALNVSGSGKINANLEINGQKVAGAFIPGRGTIISPYADVVEGVIKGGASDLVLASALGYGAPKPAEGADRVVQVLTSDGRVISEEAVNEDTLPAAVTAAQGIMNPEKGDTFQIIDVKDALRARKRRLAEEQEPVVRNLDFPDEVIEAFEGTDLSNPSFNIDELDTYRTNDYKPRTRNNEGVFPIFRDTKALRRRFDELFPEGFATTITDVFSESSTTLSRAAKQKARNQFQQEVGDPSDPVVRAAMAEAISDAAQADISDTAKKIRAFLATFSAANSRWDTDFYGGMSDAAIQKAIELAEANVEVEIIPPNKQVAGTQAASNGAYTINARNFENEVFTTRALKDGEQVIKRVLLPEFLRNEVTQASQAPEQYRNVSVVRPDGTRTSVSLVSLANAGRRIDQVRNPEGMQTAGTGLLAMVGELLANRYQITIGDQSLTQDSPLGVSDIPADIQALRDEAAQSGAATTAATDERTLLDAVMRAAANPTTVNLDRLGGFADVSAGVQDGRPVSIRQLLQQVTPEVATPVPNERETRSPAFPSPSTGKRANSRIIDYPDTQAEFPESGVVEVRNQAQRSSGAPTYETITDAGGAVEGFDTAEGEGYRASGEIQAFSRETGSNLIDDVAAPTHRYSTFSSRRKATVSAPLSDPKNRRDTPALVINVLNAAVAKLGMKRPTDLFLASQLAGLSRSQMLEKLNLQIADPVVAQRIFDEFVNLMESESGLGRMVGFADANFILVNDLKTSNNLETALVAAHELGHAFFREELDGLVGKPIFKRMWKAFQARDRSEKAYSGPLGFEEWYADQLGAWAFGEYRNQKASNLVDSYFKKLVTKLREMFKGVRASLQRRMGRVDVTFESYMQEVVRSSITNNSANQQAASRTASSAGGVSTQAHVRNLDALAEIDGLRGAGLANQIKEIISGLRNNPAMNPIRKFLYTADSYLRSVAGDDIANMFYREAQKEGSGGSIGMLKRRERALKRLRKKFQDEVGDLNDDSVRDAVARAATEDADAELDAEALKVREFLRGVYSTYIVPAQRNFSASNKRRRINFASDYFPVVHNLLAVSENSDAYLELLQEYNPDVASDVLSAAVQQMIAYQDAVNNQDLTAPTLDPASNIEKSRLLTANIPIDVLQAEGFLVDPADALQMYLGQLTKRVEWNRATRDEKGNDLLGPKLRRLDPKQQKDAQDVINAYLGYGNQSMSPHWRKIQSYVAAANYTLLLPLAVIGSLPELAGPIINSKEFDALEYSFRVMKESLTRSEIKELAEDIGVVSNDALANGYITVAEQEHLDPGARRWTDVFFRATFLEQYTNFTRTWATGMGVQFLIRHAENRSNNPNSERYLQDLGVSAADVRAWVADRDITTESGKRVSDALYKFVESSILRPNAAERPIWASDPRFMLIWQLKSYFYAFHKVITSGVLNELDARNRAASGSEQRVKNGMALLGLAAVATLPLAMMGMELREYIKDAAAETLTLGFNEKNFYRTDSMSWGDYLSTAIEKTGVYGPLGIVLMAKQSSQWGQGGIATLLGPTAENVEQFMQDGFEVIPNRLIPVYSYLY